MASFITIPTAATNQVTPKSGQPCEGGNAARAIGVIEPAIRIKMAQ